MPEKNDQYLENFLNFFRNLENEPHFMTPNDEKVLKNYKMLQEFNGSPESYPQFFQAQEKYSLTNYLIPEPFCGNIENAKIVFVNFNPKLSGKEYSEQQNNNFRNMLKGILRQGRPANSVYPFFALDPQYSHVDRPGNAAYSWWKKKIDQGNRDDKSLIRNIVAEKKNKKPRKVNDQEVEDAIKQFSKIFCNIELVPYHSKNFSASNKWISELDVTKNSLEFIQNYLIPKAKRGEILLLIRSGVKEIFENAELLLDSTSENVYLEQMTQNVTFGIGKYKVTTIGEHILEYIKNNDFLSF